MITHRPTGVSAQASERRSQAENQSVALFRLRIQLAIEVRSLREDRPSELWKSRLNGTRIQIHESHQDFPALLAESLDFHQQFDFRLPELATFLSTSASQLTKFWKKAPAALALVKLHRIDRGLRPLE